MGIIVAGFALFGMVVLFLLNESLYDMGEESVERQTPEPLATSQPYIHKKAA